MEVWVSSPEPAVGVFTPAGTCPGRLWRHCVIGYADPGQNPSAVRFGSSRVRGRGLGRTGRGRSAEETAEVGNRPAADSNGDSNSSSHRLPPATGDSE
jgi:hypothetical protein